MTGKNDNSTQSNLFQFHAWNKDRPRCFENFLQTKENKAAYEAAQAAALQPGEVYNPLYIYGGTCTGKTYLLYAIENFLHKHSPQLKILHVTMETFMNELSDAIRERNDTDLLDFRSKYRGADVLLVDDVQSMVGKENCMEEFLYTFNALYDTEKQIVITGNHHPETLKKEGLGERLAARLLFGRAVEIRRRSDTADRTEGTGMSPEITEDPSVHCGSMNFSDDDEDDGIETTREMLRSCILEIRFRDEAAQLPERKNVAKPEEAEGSAVPEETAFHLISKYWDQILDKVRTDYGVSDIPWRLWICPLKPVEMRKRELHIVCGMDIGTTMAERKYSGMIRDAVEQVTGIQIDPVFLPPEKPEIDAAEMMEYIKKLKETVPEKAARFLLSAVL